MPGAYTIDLARSLVLSRGWGVVTDRELLAHARALTADLRDVTDAQVTASTNKQMLVRLNPFGAGARRAMVVTCDVAFGMARMYQIPRDGSPDKLEIFREMDDALQWLGIVEAKAELLSALSKAPPIPGLD